MAWSSDVHGVTLALSLTGIEGIEVRAGGRQDDDAIVSTII